MLNRLLTFVLVLFALSAQQTFALPIAYDILLEIDTIRDDVPTDSVYQIGNRYAGSFVVDDAVLAEDGLGKPGTLTSFVIFIEDYEWSLERPDSDFVGFRGPDPTDPDGLWLLGGPSPGFDVVGGEIVNLRGGVFGAADPPFVDFTSRLGDPADPISGVNRFNSLVNSFGRSSGGFQGSLNIVRAKVGEPATFVLLAIGLIGLGVTRRRRV